MPNHFLVTSIKSAVLFVALMVVQHLDELWRGGLTLSPSYLLICGVLGLLFTAIAYQFHAYRRRKNPAYSPDWLYSPLMVISVPLLLISLTIWRG